MELIGTSTTRIEFECSPSEMITEAVRLVIDGPEDEFFEAAAESIFDSVVAGVDQLSFEEQTELVEALGLAVSNWLSAQNMEEQ